MRVIKFTRPDAAAPTSHSPLSKLLHWGSVAAIVVAACAVIARAYIEHKGARVVLLDLHRQAGLLVLLALLFRLGSRLRGGLAHHTGDMPRSMRLAAMGAHFVLYGALFVIPLLGWAVTSAHGVDLKFLGMIDLPSIVPADPDVADDLTDWHLIASWALLGLVVLHIGAALYHHFVRRDGVLLAMLPQRRAAAPAPGYAASGVRDAGLPPVSRPVRQL